MAGAGDTVGGRYRLSEVIGAGGMGRVWRAEDELLRRTVAVKEIPAAGDAAAREARAAARLDHPGVVKVYDVVEERDRSWIVMEHVPSRSLRDAVLADGPLTHREAARIGAKLLAALRAAHRAGVLHRDVKPQNVLLAEDGRVVLGDFGLATTAERDSRGDPLIGSPHYIAPERLRTGESAPAADLWSLGATLYTAVEGAPPFGRPDVAASLQAVAHAEPRTPERPGPLTPVILDLLAKNPADRPAPGDLAARLDRIATTRPPSGGGPRGRAVVTAPKRRRKPAGVAIAGAVAAVLVAGTVTAALSRPRTATFAAVTRPAATPVALTGLCTGDPAPITPATTRIPAGVPAGMVWVRDPAGFALAVPRGWQRSQTGTSVCFTGPDGRTGPAAFTVSTTTVNTREPLAYWKGREKSLRAGGELPGYHRISMDVLLLRRGGADWEYTWRPDSDTVRHERRILLAVTDDRSYLLRWTTADAAWQPGLRLQRRLVDMFASDGETL